MASYIARRKFLAMVGGAASAWPLAARGQFKLSAEAIGPMHGVVVHSGKFPTLRCQATSRQS